MMSARSDYKELLPAIKALPPEAIVSPNMPVDVFVQEAENLYLWCFDDQADLMAAGLDWTLVTKLPVRAGACHEANSRWITEPNRSEQAGQDWREQSPGAFLLRDQLIHTFSYAFRGRSGLLARIQKISSCEFNSDLVRDLKDLSVLGINNADLIRAVGLDLKLFETAAILSDHMGDLLKDTNGERQKDNTTMILRDKAYTYLKLAMDEIRECGKYVFWRTPDRLEGYTSEYWKHRLTQPGKPPPIPGSDQVKKHFTF